MKVIYGEGTRESPEQSRLLEHATERLEEAIGPSAANVTAEWGREAESPRGPLFRLRISDWTGEASASFAPDELKWANHLDSRLYVLWGFLLQARYDKQFKDLMGTSA